MRLRECVLGLALLTAPALASDRAEAQYTDRAAVYTFFSPSEMMAKHDISVLDVKRMYRDVEKKWRDRFGDSVDVKIYCTASRDEEAAESDGAYCGFYFSQSASGKRGFLDMIERDAALPSTFVKSGQEHKLVKSDEELCAALGYESDCLK